METQDAPQKNIAPHQPPKRAAGKWPVIGKFLRDVGRFIFDEDKGSEEVKRDLGVLEMTRAQAKAAAKAAKAAAEAEARRRKQEEKMKAEAAAKKEFLEAKLKTVNRFKQEREAILKRKEALAQQLLKAKQAHDQPVAKHNLGWFKPAPAKPGAVVSPAHDLASPRPLPPTAAAPAPVHPLGKEDAAKKLQAERVKHDSLHQREQIENRPWQSYNIVATNLIREQQSMFLNWQGKALLLALFVALSVLFCVLAYGLLLILEKDKLNSNDYVFKNLDSIVTQIKREESYTQEILTFNDKLLAVDYLLKNHIYWTNFFKFLEDNTISDVYLESFSGDTAGKYTVPAVAKDFRSISLQLKVLQAAVDKVVSVDSGGAETANKTAVPAAGGAATTSPDTKVKFNLNLNLNRSLFIKEPVYE